MTDINLLKFTILLLVSLGCLIASPFCYFNSGDSWFDSDDKGYKLLTAAIAFEVVGIILAIIDVTIVMFSFYVQKG